MPRRVAGGEPGTQETRGQGGEAGNRGQVGRAGELGSCRVPPWANPGRDVLRVGTESIAAAIPSRGGSGPALPVCCGVVAGRCRPLPGMGHVPWERAELLASQPRWVPAGPHGKNRRSSETAP